MSRQRFDLVVVGGGIHGAATAREAVLGGLKVALVEARDFSSATSSRSSKLIHGGLRYLERLQFRLVHEARQERRRLLALAPHLARPVPFLLPIFRGDPYSPLKVRLGLSVYDLLGNLGAGDRHQMLDREQALALVPALRAEDLRAAALYHDSVTDDARLTVETVLDAADHGAVVANYAEVRALAAADGRVTAAEVEDRLTRRRFEVSGRIWVNASGPWVDQVRALVPGFDGRRTVRLSKGAHLVIPAVTGKLALLAAAPEGDRVFLMVPWHEGALLGTTDTDFEGDPEAVAADDADSEYLLRAANRVLALALTPADIRCRWAGLRALVVAPAGDHQDPSAVTREYRFHWDPWAENLVSICGGKLTTARALAEKLVLRLAHRGGAARRGPSSRAVPFPGGQTGPFEAYVRSSVAKALHDFRVPEPVAERIVRTYGSRWHEVLEPIRAQGELAEPLPGAPVLLAAEVHFALGQEMAMTAEDFLLRRSGLNWAGSLAAEARPAVERIVAARATGNPTTQKLDELN